MIIIHQVWNSAGSSTNIHCCCDITCFVDVVINRELTLLYNCLYVKYHLKKTNYIKVIHFFFSNKHVITLNSSAMTLVYISTKSEIKKCIIFASALQRKDKSMFFRETLILNDSKFYNSIIYQFSDYFTEMCMVCEQFVCIAKESYQKYILQWILL